jgi:putative sterol carrier protein
MKTFTSLAEVLNAIQESFDPVSANGERAMIQFDFVGDVGGRYWLKVEDGRCDYGGGEAPETAAVTISCTPEDWLSILNDTLSPVSAFTRGRLKVKGDVATALKLQKWFPKPS